jgi:5-methyltetrahydrofolate--homocysteine methyltransferase
MVLDKAGWSALGALTPPDLVQAIHEDYARAGAEIHITNTFATSRHGLEAIGHADKVETINVRAVELCRAAIARAAQGRRSWIVGSISTYAHGSSRAALPPHKVLRETFAEQCRILAGAGVDALALEMLLDIDLSLIMAEAAAATRLPYWLGFTCRLATDGTIVAAGAGATGAARTGRSMPCCAACWPVCRGEGPPSSPSCTTSST